MKRLTLLTVAFLACTSSDAPETATSIETANTTTASPSEPAAPAAAREGDVRVLDTGSYGAAATGDTGGRRAPFVLVARDVEEFARLWGEHVGNKQLPAVDFSRERAVFLLMGPQSTGGYSIELHDAERDGDRLRIDATVHHPSSDSIVTQAFTAPYAVIAVRDRGFRSVEWMNERRLLARTDLAN